MLGFFHDSFVEFVCYLSEKLLNINILFGASFEEQSIHFASQTFSFFFSNGPLTFKIAFIANDSNYHFLLSIVLDIFKPASKSVERIAIIDCVCLREVTNTSMTASAPW